MHRACAYLIVLVAIGGCVSVVEPVRPVGTPAFALVEAGDRARHLGLHDEARVAYRGALDLDEHSVKAHVGLQELDTLEGRALAIRPAYRALDTGGDSAFLVGRLEGDPERAKAAYLRSSE